MKSSILILVGFLAFFWGSLTLPRVQSTEPSDSPLRGQPMQRLDQLSGTWLAFPSGLMLKINPDGTAHFGYSSSDHSIGYQAALTIEDRLLQISFTDYSGAETACYAAVGEYVVALRESGVISFKPGQDDCLLRLQLLTGSSTTFFHRIDNHFQ